MRIILSRKGFDSKYGGTPSPILPDGTMLSMPVPVPTDDKCRFDAIKFNGKSYDTIWKELSPKGNKSNFCHLDPDIRKGIRDVNENWKPAFGQAASAQGHLNNKGIAVGDLFLFFGWFKKVEFSEDGQYKYKKGARDIHTIYGYLQIGEILTGEAVTNVPWHPHSARPDDKTNAIYIASEKLIIDGIDTGLPGAGTLNFNENFVLTKDGFSRSKWKILPIFENNIPTYHSEKSIKIDKNGKRYFQSARIGQEFVFDENDKVTKWAKSILSLNK